jgi:hypothetical protein
MSSLDRGIQLMTDAHALRINSALVDAYMILERLKPGRVPDVTWFSPIEAEEASTMLRDTGIGRKQNPDGSTSMTCFVEPTRVRGLYAWTLATWADGGAP